MNDSSENLPVTESPSLEDLVRQCQFDRYQLRLRVLRTRLQPKPPPQSNLLSLLRTATDFLPFIPGKWGRALSLINRLAPLARFFRAA